MVESDSAAAIALISRVRARTLRKLAKTLIGTVRATRTAHKNRLRGSAMEATRSPLLLLGSVRPCRDQHAALELLSHSVL